MKTIDSTLEHRVLPPSQPAGERNPTLIMLHGRGTDEEDLVGLAGYLDERLMIITVRAPFRFEFGGYTWYDVGEVGKPDPVKFPESYRRLSQFVDDAIAKYPVDPRNLFLFGFSMGTAMSFALSLTRPELFCGVAANSGYVPEGTALQYRWNDLSDCAFFISHGTMDPTIPIQMAHRAQTLFASSNAVVSYHEYPMGHEISEESLNDVAAWLKFRIR